MEGENQEKGGQRQQGWQSEKEETSGLAQAWDAAPSARGAPGERRRQDKPGVRSALQGP